MLRGQRQIENDGSKRRNSIQMSFKSLVQQNIPRLHSMPTRIPRLLIVAREDERCIRKSMHMAANERRANCLPYSRPGSSVTEFEHNSYMVDHVEDGGG